MDFNQIVYQIYPLGFTGAPKENDGILSHRILKVKDWIPHLKKLGITAVYFGPIFESDRHGYDTRDYTKVDCRLGTNEDFKEIAEELHKNNISVILDGVFNHVGRGFFAFQDVLEKKWNSSYKDWFHINFDDTNQPDGFWYEGWEGHQELVKLNLWNEDVRNYLFSCIDMWRKEFHIDGIRLDVAYMLDHNFLEALRNHVNQYEEGFFLLGEMIGGDYNVLFQHGCSSVTNYECRKGIFSSFNSKNLFEIGYSLNRQFGKDPWCLYTGKHLVSFVDNHDVDRFASVIEDPRDIPLGYDLMYAMPGIPCVYYGSEWGAEGKRTNNSDDDLRACFSEPIQNALTDHLSALSKIRIAHRAFTDGDYQQIEIQNEQFSFCRRWNDDVIYFAINISEAPFTFHFPEEHLTNLLTGESIESNEVTLAGKSSIFLTI